MQITRLRLILICILTSPCHFLFAQKVMPQLSGTVTNQDQQTLAYVTIIAETLDSIFVAGTTTDSKGHYNLDLSNGNYKLHFQFIGYQTASKVLKFQQPQVLDISLEDAYESLETVEVKAEKTTLSYQIDRKVINVGKDLQSIGGDATQLLNELAEVQINPDGGLELRGSSNINLLINGKPSGLSPQDLLQQIDVTEIQQIELITTPSAKYRANGLTGIINIITNRKARRGWNSRINGSYANHPQYRGGVQTSYGGKKMTARLSANYSNNKNRSTAERERTGASFSYRQQGENSFSGTVLGLKGGMDFFINERNEFSVSGSWTDNSHLITNTAQIQESGIDDYLFQSKNQHIHLSKDYNLNYRHTFSPKNHFIEIDFQKSQNNNDLSAAFLTDTQQSNSLIDYETILDNLAIDYSNSWQKAKLGLESGLLYTQKDVRNQQNGLGFNQEFTADQFSFTENNWAAYFLLKKTWKKWSTQVGLRYEGFQSQSQFQSAPSRTDREFHNLFPSLHLRHQIKPKSQLTMAYNRRISRPGLWQVNPFSNASDPFFNQRGNPNLLPEFANNIELQYSYQTAKWSVFPSIFIRHKTNLILPIYFTDDTDQVLQGYENTGNSLAYGTEFNINYKPFHFINSTLSGNLYQEQVEDKQQLDFGFQKLTRQNLTFKNVFDLPKKIKLDLTWQYRAPARYRFSKQRARQKLDLAIQWTNPNDRINVSTRLTDVFNTYEVETFLFGTDFIETTFRKRQTRMLFLSFNYRINNQTLIKNRRRNKHLLDKSGALE